jgi:hypothetical protein
MLTSSHEHRKKKLNQKKSKKKLNQKKSKKKSTSTQPAFKFCNCENTQVHMKKIKSNKIKKKLTKHR